MSTTATAPKKTLYDHITDGILADLRKGVAPWVKPWQAGPVKGHRNFVSDRPYSGINVLLTWAAAGLNGWVDSRWLTPRQAMELGGSFKGEHTTWITFMKRIKRRDSTDSDPDSDTFYLLKGYRILNVEQVQGVEFGPDGDPPPPFNERIHELEAFIAGTGADITHGGNKAALQRLADRIVLPHPGAFESAEAYYGTALHELIHWTGQPGRLDRQFGERFGDQAYAFEELVAEIGSAFLAAQWGLQARLQHAEYIGHWTKVLEGDHRAIVTAASKAQKAVDFLNQLTGAAATDEALPKAA